MSTRRILIVDDEESILDILSQNFTREGYEVFTARNGHEALIKATEKNPQIVLLDYMMPVLDGLDALKEFKKEMPHVVVIVITGRGSEDVAVETMKRGARDYIRKPFNLDKLTKMVKDYQEEYYNGILKRNDEYVYPLADEVIHRYEYLRTVYSTPNPDITKISARFGYTRNAFYKLDREMHKFGVRGLFDKSDKEIERELGSKERLSAKKEIPRPDTGKALGERYPFSEFLNPHDKVQVKLEMLREAASNEKPHIGNISKKYGFSRQLFYNLHERFSIYGAAGLLNRKRGRTSRSG